MNRVREALFEDGHFRYTGESIIAMSSAIVGAIVGWLLSWIPKNAIPLYEVVVIAGLASILVFLIIFSFKIKIDLTWKVSRLWGDVERILGPHSWNQYQERATHFTVEKQILCDSLIVTYLPQVLKKCYEEHELLKGQPPDGVDVIIDSGTTLTPCFSDLKRHGIDFEQKEGFCRKLY